LRISHHIRHSVQLALSVTIFISVVACSRTVPGISASGTIEATEVRISSKSQGEILGLSAQEGDRVHTDDVLVTIDHQALDIQLAQAKAGVDYADAQMRLLLKGAREEDIAQATEALTQASENLKLAASDRDRTRNLFASASATKKQKDDADARYAVAEAQYAQAEQGLKKLSNLARPEEIASAQAKLQQARFSVQLLEKAVSDCTVRSPIDGTALRRLVEVGELAGVGTGLYIISDLSLVHLMIYIPETGLGNISVGQAAEVRIDSAPDRVFNGTVSYISQDAEFTPKNVQTKDERVKLVFGVKIDIPNPDGTLKPGMPADARILEQ
jgi:HlyD family secretion protein